MPTHLGPYAVHKLLGSGGMGAVYLAYRADRSYDKQVAIKVIHRGMETDRILQRFRRERQDISLSPHLREPVKTLESRRLGRIG